MEVENGPLGDKPVIFQAPIFHFHDYGGRVSGNRFAANKMFGAELELADSGASWTSSIIHDDDL